MRGKSISELKSEIVKIKKQQAEEEKRKRLEQELKRLKQSKRPGRISPQTKKKFSKVGRGFSNAMNNLVRNIDV